MQIMADSFKKIFPFVQKNKLGWHPRGQMFLKSLYVVDCPLLSFIHQQEETRCLTSSFLTRKRRMSVLAFLEHFLPNLEAHLGVCSTCFVEWPHRLLTTVKAFLFWGKKKREADREWKRKQREEDMTNSYSVEDIYIVEVREKADRGESPGWTWPPDHERREGEKEERLRPRDQESSIAEMAELCGDHTGRGRDSPGPERERCKVGGWVRSAGRSHLYWVGFVLDWYLPFQPFIDDKDKIISSVTASTGWVGLVPNFFET